MSERGLRHRIASSPLRERRRDWVAERNGELVGWARCGLEFDTVKTDVASLGVLVPPDRRGHGIGAALYDAAAAYAQSLGASRILASGADDESSRRFAEARGFRHTLTQRVSQLDTRTFEPRELHELEESRRAEGFELAPFAAFEDRAELVYAVDAEAVVDEPVDEPVVGLPLEEWLSFVWLDPDITHAGSFVVVHDGQPVTLTELIVDSEGSRARNGFTATLRAYRGRGLARLAKLASISWAAERGITSIVTDNDETNAAMLAVNTRLGYRPCDTRLSWARDVE